MSLPKSNCLSTRRRDANRHNAQRSTGPRSAAGKQRMKLNALKHGCDAAPENDAAVMRALGEDPKKYEALQRELATAFGPGEALWGHQLDDLARLYWRRNRLERMQGGLMRQALEKVEEDRRELAQGLADVTFEPSQCKGVAFELPEPAHPLLRRRLLISLWGVIRDQVRRSVFTREQRERIKSYYQGKPGWRPPQIGYLITLFDIWANFQRPRDQAKVDEYVKDTFGDEAGLQVRYQELLRLVEEQMAAEEAAFGEEMAAQERKDAMARDACLAPEGKTWEALLRQEMALDRSIDRKVKILLTMRKEHAGSRGDSRAAATAGRECRGASRSAPAGAAASPPENGPEERAAEELSKLVGLDARKSDADINTNVCATLDAESDADLKVSAARLARKGDADMKTNEWATRAARTESPSQEKAAPRSKSPEQSQHVTENKGSALEEVRK